MDKFTRKQRSAIPVEGAHNLARVDLLNDTTDMWNQCQILCGLEFLFWLAVMGSQGLGAYYQVNRRTSVPALFVSKEQRL